MSKEITTEERLENAIKHQPERYIVLRDEDGKLEEVHDRNNGRMWLHLKGNDWGCVD